MAAAAWTSTWTTTVVVVAAVLLQARAANGVLRGPPGPPWPLDAGAVLRNSLRQDAVEDSVHVHATTMAAKMPVCAAGLWYCLRSDLAASLSGILAVDQFNVTPTLVVERVAGQADGDLDRMATSLNEAGLPTLAATAIKVFETHALVWRMWPGMLHLKIFRNPGEGMDAAVEVPPNTDGRTWGLGVLGARRRLTMALLPIMYKMGVGTTLLGVLVFLALKTMFMVSILFVLAISSFAKHKLGALAHHEYHHQAPPHKEVHVHLHADPHKQAYGGWHRYGSHGPHGTEAFHSSFPSFHSGPPSDGAYYESEPPGYYHRRVGPPPAAPAPGYVSHHSAIMSRWDPTAASLIASEPAYYTGAYQR